MFIIIIIVVVVDFVIDSVRKRLDTPSYTSLTVLRNLCTKHSSLMHRH